MAHLLTHSVSKDDEQQTRKKKKKKKKIKAKESSFFGWVATGFLVAFKKQNLPPSEFCSLETAVQKKIRNFFGSQEGLYLSVLIQRIVWNWS
jgi:hypothetical protein